MQYAAEHLSNKQTKRDSDEIPGKLPKDGNFHRSSKENKAEKVTQSPKGNMIPKSGQKTPRNLDVSKVGKATKDGNSFGECEMGGKSPGRGVKGGKSPVKDGKGGKDLFQDSREPVAACHVEKEEEEKESEISYGLESQVGVCVCQGVEQSLRAGSRV